MEQVEITQTFIDEWNRIRDKVDGMSGPGIVNNPWGISLGGNDTLPDVWPTDPPTWAKITSVISSQPGRYNAKLVKIGLNVNATGGLVLSDVGTVGSTETLIVWNLREMGHGNSAQGHCINLNDPAQTLVRGSIGPTDKATQKPIMLLGVDPGCMFRVDLTSDGSGSLGNKSTQSSWKYNVFVAGASVQIGTSLSPEEGRTNGTLAAATKGIAYYNASGTLTLYRAAEVIGTAACS